MFEYGDVEIGLVACVHETEIAGVVADEAGDEYNDESE